MTEQLWPELSSIRDCDFVDYFCTRKEATMKGRKHSRLALYLLIAVVIASLNLPPAPYVAAGPQGQGGIHRDDPCDQLPNSPGNAYGIEKQCPGIGSSS